MGADVPGFYGKPSDELYAMFYQLGAFYPFFRAHGHIEFERREPYLQTEKVQNAVRNAINTRYDLIHYM